MTRKPTRRQFLGTTAATAAAGWTGARLYGADAPAKPGPNDTVSMALIGCGPRGRAVTVGVTRLRGARMVAVCDVDAKRLAPWTLEV